MSSKKTSAQVREAVAALEQAEDATARLDAGRRLRQAAEKLEVDLVDEARSAGVRWADIGALYGTSKQSVQQRFRRRTPDAP